MAAFKNLQKKLSYQLCHLLQGYIKSEVTLNEVKVTK